jgi:PKD repeat protein
MNGHQRAGRAALVAAILLWGGLFLPLVSLSAVAVRNNNITTVEFVDLCPNFTAPAQQYIPMLTFTISDSANNEAFTRASVTYNGTNLSDIKAARIYRESNNAGGTFNSATDNLLATNSSITGNPIILGFSYTLQRNRDRQFYIAFDIADNATDGNRVDARIDIDMLTIQGQTWPGVVWDPAGNTTIDSIAPGNWSAFSPLNWSRSRTVNCSVNVSDWRSGLRVSSAEYQQSNDSGANWSAWKPAACTGANWTTANQTVTARSVLFANDSGDSNLIRFRIRDAAGNLGTSPNYTVPIDSAPPSGWLLRFPVDWYSPDRRPAVQVAASDNLSGLDINNVSAEYSVDGGGNWTPAPSVNCSGSRGTLFMENVTAWSVPFDQDSATQNLIRFNVSDAAGNWNRSPAYTIKIDATPPDAPGLAELPRFANGSTRALAWNTTADLMSGLDRFLAVCDDASDFSSPEQTLDTNGTSCEFANLTDGVTYYYEVAAIDLAGHQGAFSLPRNCTQDASAPFTVAVTSPAAPNGADGWFTTPVNVTFSAQDNTSGISWTEYSIDGGPFVEGTSAALDTDGTHTLAYRSEDLVGNIEEPGSFIMKIDTTHPAATMSLPKSAYVNTTVQYDASASIDALGYFWDFGDGTNSTVAASGHMFAQVGMFHVTLTVTDRAGLTGSTASDINILSLDVNYPPEAAIGQLGTVYAGETAGFNGSGSTDEDQSTLSYDWDFGDGATAAGATATHIYAREGDYNISLKVTDRGGLADIASRLIRVFVKGQNQPPLAQITQLNIAYMSEPVVLDGSNSTDEDLPRAVFSWDFGDGTSGRGALVTHTYMSDSVFLVRLNVTDTAGLSGTVQISLKVFERGVNLPPSAQFTYQPFKPKAGQGVEFDATDTVDESPATLNYTWNFGDGSVAHGKVVTHSYASAGQYKVTLRVRDNGALTDVFNYDVTVVESKKPVPPSTSWTTYLMVAFALMAVALVAVAIVSRRRKEAPAPPPGTDEEPHAPEGPQSLIAPTPVTHTQSEVVIEEGLNYLIDRESPDTAYTTLSKLAAEGASAMLITPVHPNKVNKSYDMENVEMFWLSDAGGETPSIDPSKMEYELAEKIITFIKEKEANAIVLLDGLELLVQSHSFDKVMEFIHTINEVASMSGATVLVNVNGKAFKEVELNQLKRKFDRW